MNYLEEIAAEDFFAFFENQAIDVPVFAQKNWLDSLGADLRFYGIYSGSKIRTVCCFEILKKGPFKLLLNPYFTPYIGPWTSDLSFLKEDTLLILTFLENKSHELQFRPEIAYEPDFVKHQSCRSKRTFILDLKPDEHELFAAMSSSRRRNIKKLEQASMQVREGSVEELMAFYSLTKNEKSFHLSIERFSKCLRADVSKFMPVLVHDSESIGGILVLTDNKKAYYLGGGFKRDHQHSQVIMARLIWEGIKWAKAQGLEFFDFEGSDINGVAEFYKKFGAVEYNYLASSNVPKSFRVVQKIKNTLLG